MKKNNIIGFSIYLMITVLIATSCINRNKEACGIIDSPKINSEFIGIIEDLRSDYKVITLPLAPGVKAIHALEDINDEGDTFIVAFKELRSEGENENKYGLAAYKLSESGWRKVKEFQLGKGDAIDKIILKESKEGVTIYANTSFLDGSPGNLKVFTFSNSYFSNFGNINCSDFEVISTEEKKPIVATLDKTLSYSEVKVIDLLDKKNITKKRFQNQDRNYEIKIGKIDDDNEVLFIYIPNTNVYSNLEVLIGKDGNFKSVLNLDKVKEEKLFQGIKELRSVRDINNDGNLELVYCRNDKRIDKDSVDIFYGYAVDTKNEIPKLVYRGYENDWAGYRIDLPLSLGNELIGKKIADSTKSGEYITFVSSINNEKLFTVVSIANSEIVQDDMKEYSKIGEGLLFTYYMRSESSSIDLEEMMGGFHIIEGKKVK